MKFDFTKTFGGTRVAGTTTRDKMLAFIIAYWREHQHAPSLRAIQEGCHISSVSVVRYHLLRMREFGMINYEEHTVGSVRPMNLRISFDGDAHE